MEIVNRHIVVNYQPFTLNQNIYVYDKGECIDQAHVTLNRVQNVVRGFCSKYNISRVSLVGSKDYLKKFQEEMLTDYSNIEVSIVEVK